ncbi:sigma-54 dependent transcriptional regulator [Pendulispora brunnea]|uniref:Sigma-54 dependent transcriptional regulator n=1 Tax=Pendulispora brunnea TaxID=2905690 RepID=A0ABZ2K4M8_9BACT
MASSPRILIADDQSDIVEALRLLLKREFTVHTAASPAAVLEVAAGEELDLVLMDLNYARDTTSGKEGFELLDKLRELDATLPVVVMTAWGSIEGAVEAVRRGARDYVQKPWESARLLATLRTQVELGGALRRSRRLEQEASRQRAQQLPKMIANAPAMKPVLALIERVAPSDANVLILGEHGTGKEVIARRMHEGSLRASKPFVAVDAGGLSPSLFESELFGHVRGAFTDAKTDRVGCFELADGGTLFLDEIGNLPIAQQVKLLRVIQTGEFHPVGSSRTRRANVRVLAATNVDIGREVAEGRFREDLLYRLNTVEVHLPPLRERREDIGGLAAHFLERVSARYGKAARSISPGAMRALTEHTWPGNVRELEHVMERSVLMAIGDAIAAEDLGLRKPAHAPAAASSTASPSGDDEGLTLDQIEYHAIQRALARAGGNVNDAAVALGLSRSALYRRLQAHGIKAG